MSYVLFISESKLKSSTAVNLNVDVDLLLPFVREAQKLYVETALGTELTEHLKNHIIAGTALSTEEAQHLREEILNTASYYRERLIDYIRNNISSFPSYNTNSGADVSPSIENYYAGMNLDRPRQGTKLTLRNFLNAGD